MSFQWAFRALGQQCCNVSPHNRESTKSRATNCIPCKFDWWSQTWIMNEFRSDSGNSQALNWILQSNFAGSLIEFSSIYSFSIQSSASSSASIQSSRSICIFEHCWANHNRLTSVPCGHTCYQGAPEPRNFRITLARRSTNELCTSSTKTKFSLSTRIALSVAAFSISAVDFDSPRRGEEERKRKKSPKFEWEMRNGPSERAQQVNSVRRRRKLHSAAYPTSAFVYVKSCSVLR